MERIAEGGRRPGSLRLRRGMLTLEGSLAALVRAGRIAGAEARSRASHPDDLASALRG